MAFYPRPRSRIMLCLGTLSVVGLVVLAGCGEGQKTEAGAEASLDKGFLDPLDDAGLRFEVLSSCHYQRGDNEPWHFAVHVSIQADMNATASALEQGVDVINEREPGFLLQQFAGKPNNGWTGSLAADGETTMLEVVKNNIDVDGRPGVGWLPVCAESVS